MCSQAGGFGWTFACISSSYRSEDIKQLDQISDAGQPVSQASASPYWEIWLKIRFVLLPNNMGNKILIITTFLRMWMRNQGQIQRGSITQFEVSLPSLFSNLNFKPIAENKRWRSFIVMLSPSQTELHFFLLYYIIKMVRCVYQEQCWILWNTQHGRHAQTAFCRLQTVSCLYSTSLKMRTSVKPQKRHEKSCRTTSGLSIQGRPP